MAEQPVKPASAPAGHTVPFDPPADDRRGFLKKVGAVAAGTAAAIIPVMAGLVFFLDPARRGNFIPLSRRKDGGGSDDGFIRVAPLSALPDDGSPQRFTVITDQADAWNYFPDQRVGNVFLRKISADNVIAFNETCPHLGCSVEYDPAAPKNEAFRCPCHASAFALDGKKSNAIPPRDLDTLEAQVRGGEVWVRYQKFISGTPDKTAT